MDNNELLGFRKSRYLSRSWRIATGSGGMKTIALTWLVTLIPIVGPIMQIGVFSEHARRVAWGSAESPEKSGPTSKGIGMGKMLSSGWKAFVPMLVWYLAVYAIDQAVSSIPGANDSAVVSLLLSIFGYVAYTLIIIMGIYAVIYQRMGAGFRLDRGWEMFTRDFGGILRIFGMTLLLNLILTFIVMGCIFIAIGDSLTWLMQVIMGVQLGYFTSDLAVSVLADYILSKLGSIFLIYVVTVFLVTMNFMVYYTAYGLWMRQFNLPAWGKVSDPIPPSIPEAPEGVEYDGLTYGLPPQGAPYAPQGQYGSPYNAQYGAQNQYGAPASTAPTDNAYGLPTQATVPPTQAPVAPQPQGTVQPNAPQAPVEQPPATQPVMPQSPAEQIPATQAPVEQAPTTQPVAPQPPVEQPAATTSPAPSAPAPATPSGPAQSAAPAGDAQSVSPASPEPDQPLNPSDPAGGQQ